MRSSRDTSQVGVKLGPKLARIIEDTIVQTKRKLLDTEHRARVGSIQEVVDRAGREVADLIRPVFQEALDGQDVPDEIRDFFGKVHSGTHQWQAIAGMIIGYSGAGNTLSMLMSNTLAPVARDLISRRPNLVPDVSVMAQLRAKGIIDAEAYGGGASGQGYEGFWAQGILEGFTAYPDLTTTLELVRRGLVDHGTAEFFLERNGISIAVRSQLLQFARIPLSPADLADMVVRGIKSESEAAHAAAESGMAATDFHSMVLDTGEPPGLQQLLEARRRGFIDSARLVHGILQSRYRNEWIDVIERLAFTPMSVADAVNAVVQDHMTLARGNELAEQNGLEPGQFDILYETAGEPLSRTELEQLYNRGLITQATVEQGLRESRLKNKYIPDAFQLHRRILPLTVLREALRYGAISHDAAVRAALENGYSRDDAEVIVKAGSHQATVRQKNLTVAEIETMYSDSLLPASEATTMLKGLGYSEAQASFIIKTAEFRRMAAVVRQVTSAIRSKYVARHITRNQATGYLDAAGIPAAQRNTLMPLWDIERDAARRTLTEAQVVKAVAKNLITPQQGTDRLVYMGYSADDAGLLLQGA